MADIAGTGMFPWAVYVYLGILALGALIGAIDGFNQGISRGVIRFVTIIASVVLAIMGSKFLYGKVMEALGGMTIEDIYSTLTNYIPGVDLSIILNFDVETVLHIIAIPLSLIVLPMVFTLAFILIAAIMKLVHVILCGIFGLSKTRNNAFTKTLGLFLGLVQGVAVAAVLIMPIIGIGTSATAAINELNEKAPEDQSTVELTNAYNTYVKDFAENPVATTLGSLGMNSMYEYIVTVEVCGAQTDMTTLMPDAATLYIKGASLSGFDWKHPTPEQKQTLREMNDVIEANPYFSGISAGLIRGGSKTITSGNFPIFSFPEPFNTIVNEALSIFHTSTKDNLHTDVDTLLDVYFLLADVGVLESLETNSENVLGVLTAKDSDGKTAINRIIDTINANERMKPLVTLFTKLSLSIMSDQLGLGEEVVDTYENVKGGLNEALQITKDGKSEEEYIEEVSASLDTTLKENNIELEPEIVDTMAEYIADNFTAGETLTDEEINDIILNYYDAYLEYQESGTLPPEPPMP